MGTRILRDGTDEYGFFSKISVLIRPIRLIRVPILLARRSRPRLPQSGTGSDGRVIHHSSFNLLS